MKQELILSIDTLHLESTLTKAEFDETDVKN